MRQWLLILLVLLLVAAGPRKILFLGDSLTEGYGVPAAAAYPAVIDRELKARGYKDLVIVNAGISGSTSASGVARLKWALRSEPKPFILVLALGANDGLRGVDLSATRKNLGDTLHLAKVSGIPHALLAGMLLPPNYGKEYTAGFAAMFPAVARAEGATLIPFLLEGVAADKKLNQADGIHPTVAGHLIVAKTVLKYIEPLLGPPAGAAP
jgi:acyl-CoA thioesterase I